MNPTLVMFDNLRPMVQQGLLNDQDQALYYACLDGNYKNDDATIVVPSYLRSEALLGNQNSVQFNLSTAQNARPSEVRLNNNDNFHITHIALGIYRAAATSDTSGVTAPLQWFANDQVFTNNATNLEALYNGAFNSSINSRQVIKNFPAIGCKFVGTAQQGVANASSSTTAAGNQLFDSSQASYEDIWVPMLPMLKVPGSSQPSITLNLGTGVDMSATAPAQHFAVLLLKGFLAQTVKTQ